MKQITMKKVTANATNLINILENGIEKTKREIKSKNYNEESNFYLIQKLVNYQTQIRNIKYIFEVDND